MYLKTTGLALVLLAGAGFAVKAEAASPATATFQVTMTITKACVVTAGTGSKIALGSVTATAVNTKGSNAITVACSKTTPYYIGLAPSNASTTGAGTMTTSDALAGNTDKVPYQLYSDSSYSVVWGNTATSTTVGNGVSGTGTGIANTSSLTVYAEAPSADYTPDAYADTVTVNVNF
ncbi:Csu type fimbrial protein [Acidisoma silvae]|uniref:Spore coat protein U domain-containing protein n=1 Tax=Acidisoma silvae TaxID=2802396 RepID=A0A964E078_9PROT|nr:spore coat protein U domain-containing protein [Acidisoma silvae]MCB8876872.1 spore coat protein U domain-containing protein [Acidisoma silvae]